MHKWSQGINQCITNAQMQAGSAWQSVYVFSTFFSLNKILRLQPVILFFFSLSLSLFRPKYTQGAYILSVHISFFVILEVYVRSIQFDAQFLSAFFCSVSIFLWCWLLRTLHIFTKHTIFIGSLCLCLFLSTQTLCIVSFLFLSYGFCTICLVRRCFKRFCG